MRVGDDDTVVLARAGDRDEAVPDIPDDFLDRSLKGIAVPSAARIEVGDRLAGFRGLDDVLADRVDLAAALDLDAADLGVD